METCRVAAAARMLGILAVALFAIGPATTSLGLLGPEPGFRLFGGSLLLGLLAVVTGLIGLVRTRVATGREGRGKAVLGTALGGAVAAVILAIALPTGSLPVINDITTSPDDPPAFRAALELPGNRDRDMGYPPDFAAQQRRGYPDLAPIALPTPPAATLDRVADLARGFGWTVVARDDAAGTLEATETSGIFRFVDDVVVRVRPSGDGSIVDVRSKSRVGRGDLGANAARIRRLAAALAG